LDYLVHPVEGVYVKAVAQWAEEVEIGNPGIIVENGA
jgi:hypothetical protein